MVDAIVSHVINQLATIIQQEIKQEVRLVVGVEKDIEKLTRTFTNIQVVLKDAEKKQIMDDSVGVWLQDLKDVAYDIDDVLDEWRTAILKSQLELQVHHDEHGARSISPTTMKVCYPFCNLFSFIKHRIGLRHNIGRRINDINERVDQIASDQTKFGFIGNDPNSRNYEMIDDEWSRRRRTLETSSLDVDVKGVFGRDMDGDTIISKLLSDCSQREVVVSGIPVISIVGMPGLGKTTLSQIVFNDDRVKNHFIERMWIYVSKPFDRVKVALNIITEMGGHINNDITQGISGHDIAWQAVHRQLIECVTGKQFLLVLDDVWNDDPMLWDPLRISLQSGSQVGSRILVTTRHMNVARMMGTTYVHRLGVLSNQDCWSLLSHYAFVGRQKEECEKLKEIGMKLANKCHGLPLSAKTLGSLLCFKKSKQDWQCVLESDVWRVVSTVDQPILPALMLSYNDLPSHLKQCFAYCSLVPRDYLIGKGMMVREWMAQGFLSDSLVANDENWIAIGDEYFNNLELRSFVEKVVEKSGGSAEYYKMHDLVHDFAKSLVEKECFNLTIKDTNAQEFDFIRVRRLRLLVEEIKSIPSFIYKAKNVRTLKIKGHIPSVSSKLFHHLKCLRTLDLSYTRLEELPKEIENLIHLRWLNLSGTRFQKLPNTVTNLYNLKALHLCKCDNLRKLPEGIERLVNLIDFSFAESRKISYLPEGIGKLTKLRYLSNFIIGGVERGGCTIRELKDLNFLKGSLKIIGLGRVENGNEAKMACLENKQHLRALYLYFNQYTGVSLVDEGAIDGEGECREKYKIIDEEGTTEEVVDREGKTIEEEEEEAIGGEDMLSTRMEGVLESLRPHSDLEKLIIREYLGTVFPNWIVSHADFMRFSNLTFLELNGWSKCKQLPSTIGKLPSLETLVIHGMDKVKFMDIEFFEIDGATTSDGRVDTIFPKLEVFQLGKMRNLEEWDMRVRKEDGKEFIFMPCLQYLVISHCKKLRWFPQHLTQATSLRKLMIWDCPKLSWMPSPSSHLIPSLPIEELILKQDAGSFSKSLLANSHMFLPKLKLLRVRESPYPSLPQGLGQLASLEILDIRTCCKIKSIPEEEFQHLTALKELWIIRCPALRRSCQKEGGEDWSKISHIPKIFIDQIRAVERFRCTFQNGCPFQNDCPLWEAWSFLTEKPKERAMMITSFPL